jgi:hypothetical protein
MPVRQSSSRAYSVQSGDAAIDTATDVHTIAADEAPRLTIEPGRKGNATTTGATDTRLASAYSRSREADLA